MRDYKDWSAFVEPPPTAPKNVTPRVDPSLMAWYLAQQDASRKAARRSRRSAKGLVLPLLLLLIAWPLVSGALAIATLLWAVVTGVRLAWDLGSAWYHQKCVAIPTPLD